MKAAAARGAARAREGDRRRLRGRADAAGHVVDLGAARDILAVAEHYALTLSGLLNTAPAQQTGERSSRSH